MTLQRIRCVAQLLIYVSSVRSHVTQEAIAKYREASAFDPTLATAHYNTGIALQARAGGPEDTEAALRSYERAGALDHARRSSAEHPIVQRKRCVCTATAWIPTVADESFAKF